MIVWYSICRLVKHINCIPHLSVSLKSIAVFSIKKHCRSTFLTRIYMQERNTLFCNIPHHLGLCTRGNLGQLGLPSPILAAPRGAWTQVRFRSRGSGPVLFAETAARPNLSATATATLRLVLLINLFLIYFYC